jgi:hypothetical protein
MEENLHTTLKKLEGLYGIFEPLTSKFVMILLGRSLLTLY